MKWLKENNCPWDEMTFTYAVTHNFFKNMKWLKKNNCPYDEKMFKYTKNKNKEKINKRNREYYNKNKEKINKLRRDKNNQISIPFDKKIINSLRSNKERRYFIQKRYREKKKNILKNII
jgi:hypothetical protein